MTTQLSQEDLLKKCSVPDDHSTAGPWTMDHSPDMLSHLKTMSERFRPVPMAGKKALNSSVVTPFLYFLLNQESILIISFSCTPPLFTMNIQSSIVIFALSSCLELTFTDLNRNLSPHAEVKGNNQ